MPPHKSLPAADVHIAYQWVYADEAARTGATGFVSSDVGKLALQSDNISVWMLTAVTPTWTQFTAVDHDNTLHDPDNLTVGGNRSDANLNILVDGGNADAQHWHHHESHSVCGIFYDEFFDTLSPAWVQTVTGNSSVTPASVNGGVLSLNAGSQVDDYVQIALRADDWIYRLHNTVMEFRLNIGSGIYRSITAGFVNSAGTAMAAFRCDEGSWLAYTKSSIDDQTTNTGVTPDTDAHIFRIELEYSSAKFYIDGVLKATHTGVLPEDPLRPVIKFVIKIDDLIMVVFLDYFFLRTDAPGVA